MLGETLRALENAIFPRTLHVYACLVKKLCPSLCEPMDGSPPGFSVHEIFQARVLEWVAISYSRGSSGPRDLGLASLVSSALGGGLFITEPSGKPHDV